jgi:hypothetical protein
VSYATYIAGHAWHTCPARRTELEASGFRCRVCNAGRDKARLEVHHRTYERLGREHVGDLTTLCSECHEGVTDFLRRRRYAGRKLVTDDYRSSAEERCNLNKLMIKGGRP